MELAFSLIIVNSYIMDLNLEYLNNLASQILLISSLLGGFSIAIVANLLTNRPAVKVINHIFKFTTLASGAFLVSIFAMTKIVMMTTKGYPRTISLVKIEISNLIGALSFLSGITFLCIVIGLSGWTKSRRLGIFTAITGSVTFFLILLTTAGM